MTIKVKPLGRLTVVGALIMIIGLLGATAASASTKVPIWSSGGTHLPFGEEVPFTGPSISGMNLKWNASGIPIWIQCVDLSASGTVENYASGKPGTLKPGEGPAAFQGCQLVEPSPETTGCHIPTELSVEMGSGELANSPYPNGGLTLQELSLTEFEIEGCKSGAFLNYPWKIVATNPAGNEGKGAWPGEVLFPEGTAVKLNGVLNGEIEFGLNIQGSGFTPIKITEEEITKPSTPGHHYWYTGGGMRKGEGPFAVVPPGSPLAVSGGSNSITLESVPAGVTTVISCSGAGSTTGSVENPAGEKDGVANVSFGFVGCTVVKPEKKSCTVEGGSISTASLVGSVTGAGEHPPFQLKPASGPIATFNIVGCTVPSPNGKYDLTGSLIASPYGGKPGIWTIPSASNGKSSGLLKLRGQAAGASGEVTAVNSKGEMVTLSN